MMLNVPYQTALSIAMLVSGIGLALLWQRHAPKGLQSVVWLGLALGLMACGIYGSLVAHANRTRPLPADVKHLYALNDLWRRDILRDSKYADPLRLAQHEARVFSQNGEDGAIAEIFRRVNTTNRYFVEFGAADGFENNTVLLLKQGWKGLWMDGNPEAIARARDHFSADLKAGSLRVRETFITAENIETLFKEEQVPAEPDLLSIDIDRNDYYVWQAITKYRPRVAIVEYTALYPPFVNWVIPYDGAKWWDGTAKTGASLKALEELGRKKGYRLVGCVLAGVNAFFIRDDVEGGRFAAPYTAENHYEPARYTLNSYDSNHRRVP